MKEFLSNTFPVAHSLVGIAREMLVETRNTANTKVNDLRSQVEDLWQTAGEMLPRTKPAQLIQHHVEKTIKLLKNRDTINFPVRPDSRITIG